MLKGYRTWIVNIALAILPLAEVLGPIVNLPEVAAVIPEEYTAWYMLAVALINLYLRWITTTPLGRKA